MNTTPIYQIDAFTKTLFGGNPAAVMPLDQWLPDEQMQAIALENNLSETAFLVPLPESEPADFHIRGREALTRDYGSLRILDLGQDAQRQHTD